MKNFLQGIDLFGVYFNFTIFNKDTHRTYIGGILSLLSILSTIASTLYFGRDFYFQANPITSVDRIQYLNYPQYTINSSNFVFGFRIEDSQLNFFDENSFFEFKVVYNNSTITKNNLTGEISEYDAPTINLNFSKCDFKKNLQYFDFISSNSNVDYRNFYCIDFSNNTSLGGYWTANFTQYIDIQLVYCNSSNPNCKSINDTATYFSNNKLYLTLMTLRYFIDLTNHENPLMNYLSYNYIQIDPNLSKKVNFFMTPGLVSSKEVKSFFIDELLTYTSFNVDYLTLDTMLYSSKNNKITLTRIYFSNYLDRFKRTYVKLADLIPIIVSMHNIISFFFRSIATFYNKFDRTNKILNELFDFSDYHETKSFKINERRGRIKMSMIKNNQDNVIELEESVKSSNEKYDINDIALSDSRVGNLNRDIEYSNTIKKLRPQILIKFKDFIRNTKQSEINDNLIKLLNEKTDFSYYLPLKTFLLNICFKKSMSEKEKNIYKIYNKGNNLIKEKTDIVSFMKIIDEINKMKYVLFNQVQSLCFNFLRKPSLIEDKTEDKYSKFFNYIKGDEVTQRKDIVEHFVNQSKSQIFSHYNKAFLDIIENDMKVVIEIIEQQNNLN